MTENSKIPKNCDTLILGPMATLGHEAFRKAVFRFGGCDEFFTEMIDAGALSANGPREKFYLINECAKEKIVWQLTGNSASAISQAAQKVLAQGGIGVDLNMGCSAPEIVKKGAGIAWMIQKNPNETADLIQKTKKSVENAEENFSCKKNRVHFRLSAKIRLGDENFSFKKLVDFCEMLKNEGIEMITLHPRTKTEKYRTAANKNLAEELAQKINLPLTYNGDISDLKTFSQAKKSVPSAKAFMISRAAAQKPWIFQELRGNFFSVDLEKVALDFLSDLQIFQPQEFWPTRIRRFFEYFCNNFFFSHYAKTKIFNAKTIEQAKFCVKSYFEKCPNEKIFWVNAQNSIKS